MRKITKCLWLTALAVIFVGNFSGKTQWAQCTDLVGGDYRCLIKNGSDIFAGSQYGGVFQSLDSGSTWTPRLNGLPAGVSVTRFLGHDGYIFAGTSYWSKNGQGVYRSADNGATWMQINNGIEVNLTPYFTDLYITGLTSTSSCIFTSTYHNGIYRSADNGNNWVKVFDAYGPDSTGTGVDSTLLREINTLCSVGDILFAGGAGAQLGVHRSFDQGVTWDLVTTGFPSGAVIYQLISSGNDLYARTSHGFYWSPTNGDYFIGINNGITTPTGAGTGAIAAEGSTVIVSTYDGSEGPRTYKSTNRGSSWTLLPDMSSYYVQALMISGSSVFAGHIGNYGITSNGGGILRSLDGGATWTASNTGLAGINCRAMTSNGRDIFAGTYYYSGIYKSSNSSVNWTKSVLPGTTPNNQILCMTTAGGIHYAGVNATNGVYKTTDNGATWVQTTSIGKQVWALGANATYVFAGTSNDGMRRTSNGGTSWTTINSGLPTVGEKSVRAITVYGNKIYIGNSRGVFVSTNDGTTWTAANGGVGSPGYGLVRSVAVRNDTIFAAGTNGIIRSGNNGASWVLLTSPVTNPLALLFDGNRLYAGGGSGVYYTDDMGTSWNSMNSSFPSTPEVNVLYIANDMLYAGTYGQSVWKFPLAQAPLAFAVTGGGSYCAGTPGLPVGLLGSESGITYVLYKDNVIQSPTVIGTGNPISFGNQTAGVYTIIGTNSTGTTTMNGQAIIIEIARVPVSVTITTNINPVPAGTPVEVTATPVNGGISPGYQWFVNGELAGSNDPVFTYLPAHHDSVFCILTSSETCVSGNPDTSETLILKVYPDTSFLQGIQIGNGTSVCYDALNTIVVAGEAGYFEVLSGGSATLIAGSNIIFLPGTRIFEAGYLHAYIDTVFCMNPSHPLPNALASEPKINVPGRLMPDNDMIRFYPNPTSGLLYLNSTIFPASESITVELYGMSGVLSLRRTLSSGNAPSIDLSHLPSGLYMLRISCGSHLETARIIKQ